MRLGFKEGLPEVINGTVRFIDASGMPSNEYNFSLINEGYVEKTAAVIKPTADNKDPAYNPEITSDKTTKTTVKTTKSTTKSNDKNSSKTKEYGYTTHDIIINTSPPCTYTGTTSTSLTTTEESATNNYSTTKKNIYTTKSKQETEVITIYYVEKQIIVSNSIVTEKVSDKKQSSSVSNEKETMSDTTTMAETTVNVKENITSSDEVYTTNGTKYKYIIGAVSATVLVLLAAWSARSSKRKKDT